MTILNVKFPKFLSKSTNSCMWLIWKIRKEPEPRKISVITLLLFLSTLLARYLPWAIHCILNEEQTENWIHPRISEAWKNIACSSPDLLLVPPKDPQLKRSILQAVQQSTSSSSSRRYSCTWWWFPARRTSSNAPERNACNEKTSKKVRRTIVSA